MNLPVKKSEIRNPKSEQEKRKSKTSNSLVLIFEFSI